MNMIEKAARALILYRGMNPDDEIKLDDCLQPGLGLPVITITRWKIAVGEVRAIIEAMREPTPEMWEAFKQMVTAETPGKVWEKKFAAAIDAALAEGGGE
jgi:hypothetical protein